MRKLGVVLALLVLFGTLTAGPVRAGTNTYDFRQIVTGTEYDGSVTNGQWYNTTHFQIWGWYSGSTVTVKHDDTYNALLLQEYTGAGHATSVIYIYKEQIPYVENMTLNFTITANGKPTNWGYAVGAVVATKLGAKYTVYHYTGAYFSTDQVGTVYKINDLPDPTTGVISFAFDPVKDLQEQGVSITAEDVDYIQIVFGTDVSNTGTVKLYVYTVDVGFPSGVVTFSLKDGLTGQSLTGVTVKEDGQVLGTLDDGVTLELAKGTHTLTFEKQGYWSVTKTIDVQGDMSVSVEMYPSSAAFKLENFPSEITIPEHTVYTLTFTLSPIDTSATYNTYLSLSGLSDVLEVRKDGSIVSPEGGKYYLGDITKDMQVSIKFKASSVGTYAFSITLESSDAFGANTYTATKQVTYTVNPLPFSIQMPSEWQVGDNELRVSEASGQSYSMIVILKDSSGTEVWSGSYAFSPYEVHTFTVNVPQEGTYTLEFQWAGKVASYTINVGTGISLLTKSVSVKKGGVGTVQVQLKNPSDSTKYYTIKLEGGFLDVPVNQTVAIAPSSTKTVSIAFAVPDNVQFDAYDLTLKVLEGDAVRYSDTVHVIITGSEGSGLLPIGGGSSGPTLLLLGAAAAVGLVAILAASRRG